METENLTLEVLRGIQTTLASMRGDLQGVREDLAGTNLRLERLERTTDTRLGALERTTEELVRHQIATRESIDLLRTQAVMAGHALTQQMEARLRLDERVDGLERRVEALERDES